MSRAMRPWKNTAPLLGPVCMALPRQSMQRVHVRIPCGGEYGPGLGSVVFDASARNLSTGFSCLMRINFDVPSRARETADTCGAETSETCAREFALEYSDPHMAFL